jgi:hypothetical protein
LEQKPNNAPAKEAIQAEVSGQIAPLSQRVAAVERDVDGLTRTQNERQSDARTAALTLALNNLKRAVSEGRPFAAELSAVENLSGGKLPVSQLAPYKDKGVLSLADLEHEFDDVSRRAIQNYYRGKTSSLMGEVISRAKAAIQVRPADNGGDTAEAVFGRMGNALKAGNVKDALTAGAALDEPVRAEMQNWFEHAQERVAAEEALKKTDQELLSALTKAQVRR